MNNYLKNKIFSYRDLSTGVYLDLSIDSSTSKTGNWMNFNPIQLCFSIYDARVNENISKVSMCLRYQNILKLITNIKSVDPEKIFDTGCTINIAQYNHKSKKELVLNFGHDKHSEKIVQITIIDNTSQRGRAIANVNKEGFSAIANILNDFAANLIRTDLSMKQLFINYNVLEQLNELKEKINKQQKTTQYHDVEKYYPENTSDKSPDINEYNDKPCEPSEVQKDFMDVCEKSNMFSDVDIGIKSSDMLKKTREKLTRPDKPFIGTFLNYDLSKLETWSTSFVCLTEKSDPFSFSPFDIIMNLGKISSSEREPYMNEFGYYPMQYATIHILKNSVKNAIITGEYPKSVPAVRFNKTIERGTDLHKLSQEILVVFLMYSFINNSYINLKNVSVIDLDSFRRSYFTVKLLFSPFIFSMETYDTFIEDLVTMFEMCVESGLLKDIKNKYTDITCGGNINFNKEMFEKYCNSFLTVISNSNVDKFSTEEETKETFEKYNVPIPSIEMSSREDVKNALFDKPLVQDVEEKDYKIEEEIKPEEVDTRLDMFFECSKRYVEDKVFNGLKETCKNFDNLRKCFLKFDIPPELIKIMRAIEIDKQAITKQQVLKTAKLFKEEEGVTNSNKFQEDMITDDAMDIQKFLTSDGIF